MVEDIPDRQSFEAIFIPEGGKIVWVNEDVPALKVRVGDITNMPFLYPPFLSLEDMVRGRSPIDPDPHKVLVDVDGEHRRHSAIGSIDINGLPHQVVLKGTGLLNADATVLKWVVRDSNEWLPLDQRNSPDPEDYLRGLCGEHEALVDARIAQFVNKLGGFCATPLTISAYKKIPYGRNADGKLHYATVAELQKRGRIPSYVRRVTKRGEKIFDKNEHVETLVAYARAFETNVRINEAREQLVRAELTRIVCLLSPENEVTAQSLQGFIERSARRMGTTLGILHGLGLKNTEFGQRNMTLSGETTDLSSCVLAQENIQSWQAREYRDLCWCSHDLVENIRHAFEEIFAEEQIHTLARIAENRVRAEYNFAKNKTNLDPQRVSQLIV